MQSESIVNLAKALLAFQGEVEAIPKTSTNPFFKSKYAGLPAVVAAATPLLVKNGIAVMQFPSEGDTLTTYVLHTSGEFVSHAMDLHLVKNDPQASGSAITYARRYSYMGALGLVADEDDDGNKGSAREAKSESRRPKVTVEDGDDHDHDTNLTLAQQLGVALTERFGSDSKSKMSCCSKVVGRDIKAPSELSDAEKAAILLELA